MKKFIIISLLTAITLPMLACIWSGTNNYYLFHVYDNSEFRDRVNKICDDNWKVYLDKQDERWFSFDADEIIKVAKEKNDPLMVSYAQNLDQYIKCANEVSMERWEYPTKEQLAERIKKLSAIRTYALGKTKSRLRSQHALLYMRCNMLLGKHQDNVTFWEQNASQYIETVYKDMMKNIYAGALYKNGKTNEAGELFAEMGDYNSLMTVYYKKRSYIAIRQEYLRNPNAKVLPFLLQDFVNNAQEADDATNQNAEGYGGKLFIRDISKAEAMQMINFCGLVVKEGKTETPALWQNAKAWLEYMFTDKKQAATDIIAAASLNGTEMMKTCTRALMFYITSAQAKDGEAFDDYLADELQWIASNSNLNYVRDRVTHQTLIQHYANRPERVIALLRNTMSWKYDEFIDTMQVENLQKYLYYSNTPANNNLDRYLKSVTKARPYELEDLIGTKYMRLCQWEKAIAWLKDIPTSFYEDANYAVYAANRSYTIEPWIKRQFLNRNVEYSDTKWKLDNNPKLTFAKEMQQMESELNVLTGKSLEERYYDLAIRYSQANFRGDCWWLMRNGKSVMDEVRVNETSLGAKALELLRKASLTNDITLKEKALFALCFSEFYDDKWYELKLDDNYDYYRKVNPESINYIAFQNLYEFEKGNGNQSSYISRCDEFKQFKKLMQ